MKAWPPKIVALIPAHNEEEQIADTIAAIRGQSLRVARVMVVADNCSDQAAQVAAAAGAEVFTSVDNRARKAGALNQGFELVDDDCDFLLQTDADTILDRGISRRRCPVPATSVPRWASRPCSLSASCS